MCNILLFHTYMVCNILLSHFLYVQYSPLSCIVCVVMQSIKYCVWSPSLAAPSLLLLLQADCGWKVDLTHLESLIDSSTMAIVVSNPTFPTGTVYSETHLREILAIAERHLIPIISDECERKSRMTVCDSTHIHYSIMCCGRGGGGAHVAM